MGNEFLLVDTRTGPVLSGSEMSGCRVVSWTFTCVCGTDSAAATGGSKLVSFAMSQSVQHWVFMVCT